MPGERIEDPVALYLPEGDRYLPTVATRGPWDPRSQHGGPAAALLAHAIEQVEVPSPMPVVRLTYEFLRPVPMVALNIRTEVVRVSKRTTVLAASLLAGDAEVLRVTALAIRAVDLDLPDVVTPDDPAPGVVAAASGAGDGPEPGTGTEAVLIGAEGGYNDMGIEIRFVDGGFQYPGPASAWTRLRLPVVAGEELTPVVRAAAAADLGNGLSSVLRQRDWLYINADLTLHMARRPVGEWIGMRSVTLPFGPGAGVAESAMYDTQGRFARAVQSLVVDTQRPAPA